MCPLCFFIINLIHRIIGILSNKINNHASPENEMCIKAEALIREIGAGALQFRSNAGALE
jgi:riboflavin synthase